MPYKCNDPLHTPEILLHHITPYLTTLDLLSLKKTDNYFNSFFSQEMLLDHLKKWDNKKNQKAVYHYHLRKWDFPKLQLFFTSSILNKSLSQHDRNEGVKQFCNGVNIVKCLKKIEWMKEFGCIDLSYAKNLLLRHAIKHDELSLVDYLISNGADPFLFNAFALEWMVLHGSREMIHLILQDGIEDEVEKSLMMTVTKDRIFPYNVIFDSYHFLQDFQVIQQVFNKAVEHHSLTVLERLLFFHDPVLKKMEIPVVDVSYSLVSAVQTDNSRLLKILARYCLNHCEYNVVVMNQHVLDTMENFREAFFWTVFKQRYSLKNLLLAHLETLTRICQIRGIVNSHMGRLEGQRDLKPPIDYIFLLCTLVHKKGKNDRPYVLFEELNMEFPFANCLNPIEREFLMWFCLNQGQLQFFELAIEPIRGNCRPISEPFQVPVTIENIYSEFLEMDFQPKFNSSYPIMVCNDNDSDTVNKKKRKGYIHRPTPKFIQKTRTVYYEGFQNAIIKMIERCPSELQGNLSKMWKNMLIFLEWKSEGSYKTFFKELEKKIPGSMDWEFCEGSIWI